MSEPYLAQIRMFGGNFAPRGWAFCDGQLLPINSNQALFSLLGTTYGGDGRTTFALPDLRGRAPMHPNGPHPQGERGGEATHVLSVAEIPPHHHVSRGTTDSANEAGPAGALVAPQRRNETFAAAADANAIAGTVGAAGASGAHDNSQPSSVVNFIIALEGLFPSRN